MLVILLDICHILGVSYDEEYINSFGYDCDKIDYLLKQIYKFLGGE